MPVEESGGGKKMRVELLKRVEHEQFAHACQCDLKMRGGMCRYSDGGYDYHILPVWLSLLSLLRLCCFYLFHHLFLFLVVFARLDLIVHLLLVLLMAVSKYIAPC